MKAKLVKESLNEDINDEKSVKKKEAYFLTDNKKQVETLYKNAQSYDTQHILNTSEDDEAYIVNSNEKYSLIIIYNNRTYQSIINKEVFNTLKDNFDSKPMDVA